MLIKIMLVNNYADYDLVACLLTRMVSLTTGERDLCRDPRSVMVFMKSNNIKPNPPVLRSSETAEQPGKCNQYHLQ